MVSSKVSLAPISRSIKGFDLFDAKVLTFYGIVRSLGISDLLHDVGLNEEGSKGNTNVSSSPSR